MELITLATFAGALLINAGTPGPSVAALVSRVITNGWRDIMPFLAAMWIGEVMWLTVSLAGMATLAEKFYTGFQVLKWAGIAYLVYLAIKMWREPAHTEEHEDTLPKRQNPWSMFAAGMALTIGNPKIMVFYLALLPSLIGTQPFTLGVWIPIALTCLLVMMFTDCSWVIAASYARKFLQTPRAMRIANRVGASTLGGAALVIATRR
ncbi:MAG: LysE family translocator [Thermomicrobiales bacterium]|nr:LysE family translocator [Thermomicrobiales bacterium]MCO5219573.1 LysE family translocator [Thermomicrobiales bacterium]MCO5226082.1 LysE family translocator [Thermomicrobiales bacterium]MCO5229327.1 LysE family translocator [Thermomicrobiales bacterium]